MSKRLKITLVTLSLLGALALGYSEEETAAAPAEQAAAEVEIPELDVNQVAAAFRAEIYKYLGDGAILTWPAVVGSDRCIACFFALEDRVRARTDRYRARYGRGPTFRAGLHRGPVLVTEIGDFRREIAYYGDVLNTAARIQAQCSELGASLLVSPAIAADALRGRGHFADAAPLLGTGAVWGGFLGVSAAEPLEKSCAKKQSCGCCAP